MSLSYAESLSYFPHKGKVGMPELTEKSDDLKIKLEKLEHMIRQSRHTVAITGAGISTDAGIPDFRGPNGVWTLEKRGEKPSFNTSFDKALPTFTHRALCKLEENNYLHFVISQNIDGLHHRSGLPLSKLAELHGNVFAEECEVCRAQVIHPKSVGSYCRKRTGNVCNSLKSRNKSLSCRGKLRDTILDWEDPLPELALNMSEQHCAKADLCICLGTSLQIRPCRDLPRKTRKNGGKIVIINLQKTSLDSLADLIIHERCDHVMKYILDKLHLNLNEKPSVFNVSKYSHVKKIILLSGKSKCGRNFIGKNLAEQLSASLLHINDSLKHEYEKIHNNDTCDTDEKHIIKWAEEKCREDPTIFCRMMIEHNDQLCSSNPIWIISDIKSYAEIEFFKNHFNDRVLIVRIEASNDVREKRGWNSQADIDNTELKSQLDKNVRWSFVFSNNEQDKFNEQMNDLVKLIN
ncbi:unnamed protein product [Rotaria magnacalcarata]|uniref:protein acetyllysine N-acetyltransferase n=3 Tax=Rotaria magnacalcarata TaxID=392030 RepID=A0A816FYS4_9BILA|nr:unnamed protein product [Rotaria magnacalcarata]CAF1667273.1 unnamed protein product [Rotaria magnacalcarata]